MASFSLRSSSAERSRAARSSSIEVGPLGRFAGRCVDALGVELRVLDGCAGARDAGGTGRDARGGGEAPRGAGGDDVRGAGGALGVKSGAPDGSATGTRLRFGHPLGV